ncbi:putative ATP-grasp-modified RiPP [Streptomyces sp. NPDC058733]|uniref:putative ATP-grasp-modified RiPP n=1 Tax=Streptomyces sp. NPDC058733 TaxID=3346614 RepID=UPI00368C5141
MFVYSDRLPTGTALPTGAQRPAPWGLRRMAPYPTMAPDYAHAEIDPVTQATVFFDADGQVLEMPAHGTSTGTAPVTGTSPDGNGSTQDSDTGSDGDQ